MMAFAEWLHTTILLPVPQAQPGLVVCVHTYGDLANHHPHLHVMATDGAFTPDGLFHALPTMSLAPMEDLFRHRVCKMLMKTGLLSAERVKLMESWEHSGFNVDASVRIGVADATGRENLARYLIRAPFSAQRITDNAAESTLDFLAALFLVSWLFSRLSCCSSRPMP